ncbi:MAG: aspartate carbamoyltransferase regulatory subunit [Fervidicoccaceae archaeon]
MSEDRLTVSKIKSGTVIDHIPAGQALNVLRILGITGQEGLRTAVLMNVESRKLGKKDIVKIEGKELSPEEVNKIALIAPTATINIIREYAVASKTRVVVPSLVEGVLKCTRPTCITNKPGEPLRSRFVLVSRSPVKFQCSYCGSYLEGWDIAKQLST